MRLLIACALLLSVACTQNQVENYQKSRNSKELSSPDIRRLCTANGYLSEPACHYSVEELAALNDAEGIPIQTEGFVFFDQEKVFLKTSSEGRVKLLLNPVEDKDILSSVRYISARNRVIIFGLYYSLNDSVGTHQGKIDAYSIKWISD